MERKDFTKRYSENVFKNHPQDDERRKTRIFYEKNYTDETPFFSIVTPIYNQENIIVKNLKSVLECMEEKPYEIILILDCCSDNTEKNILNFLESFTPPKLLTSFLILKSDYPLFETVSDNLGLYSARGEYVLEIQADMEIKEKGFNMKLLSPFLYQKNVVGVSGRCCCNLSFLVENSPDKIIDQINFSEAYQHIDKSAFYVGETCNRGPLLFHKTKVEELGYLDELNYFLDDSDHDFFCRAFVEKEYICGHTYINFHAPLCDGSTRKDRDDINYKVLWEKKAQSGNGFLKTYLQSKYEERNIYKIDLPITKQTTST